MRKKEILRKVNAEVINKAVKLAVIYGVSHVRLTKKKKWIVYYRNASFKRI